MELFTEFTIWARSIPAKTWLIVAIALVVTVLAIDAIRG